MRARICPRNFSGTLRIPASKSHTIRRLLIASLADGVSEIVYPLDSLDTRSCAAACRALGAEITENRAVDPLCPNPRFSDETKLISYTVRKGDSHRIGQKGDSHRIDVGNSGTTLYLAMAAAGLGSEPFEFTGDAQIRRRSAAPLLEALNGLGIRAESVKGDGCVPVVVQGPWKGGRVILPCPTSQYLSALLLAAPLAPPGAVTEIEVPLLNERPYVEMTLSYLDAHGIPWEAGGGNAAGLAGDFSRFVIPGGAAWKPFTGKTPGDFSSAAFPACAAAVSGGPVTILGLDPGDLQGDKFFLEMLARMGCSVSWEKAGGGPPEYSLTVSRAGPLRGGAFDLNAAPDLLPAAAAAAAFAEGDTALVNVAHARIKETDRIAVMAVELAKLGVRCTELPDGLVVHGGGRVKGGLVDGRGDHRVVMALAAAALAAESPVEIDGAECAAVTYPGFLELLEAEFQ